MDLFSNKFFISSGILSLTSYLGYIYYFKNDTTVNNEIDITNNDKIEMYNIEIDIIKNKIQKLEESLEKGDKLLLENQQKYDNNSKKTPFDTEVYESERTRIRKCYKLKQDEIENNNKKIKDIEERIQELENDIKI